MLLQFSSSLTAFAQLNFLLMDDGGDERSIICPGQTGAFTCTVSGNLVWEVNNDIAFLFLIAGSETMDRNTEFGIASVVQITGGRLTSVMFLDRFPSENFVITCNSIDRTIEYSGMCVLKPYY